MDLFEQHGRELVKRTAPLADRMRPRTLDEFVGQEHIVGPGRLLRRAIQIDQLSSLIFYGPPGSGKTTLARIIANTTKAEFISINAVLAGVKDIREAVEAARQSLNFHSRRTILFIDEVHRFNKAQQDALLPHVESGLLTLIGATTENPYFEVNKALVSRSRIFQLRTLNEDDLRAVAYQALSDAQRGYGNLSVELEPAALDHLVRVANGDARGVLNALELAIETTPPDAQGVVRIGRGVAEESIQQRAVLYDKDGDAHYDTISAFIKSLRGSDPDAALYWMAKMVYAGEDPRFIFRRMLILACEDIGLADPQALGVVMSAAQAFDYVGLPEGRYHMSFACLYLAAAAKSNSTMAFFDALEAVSRERDDDIPGPLRDASRDKEGLGHGAGYLYPHSYRDHWVAQQYLPDSLQGKVFYEPQDQGFEATIRAAVMRRREAQIEAVAAPAAASVLDDAAGLAEQAGALWQRRTSQGGATLEQIRDTLFELAAVEPGSLVLDAHARSGLCTFEAWRRAPRGAVWALTFDTQQTQTLQALVARGTDPLQAPQVVQTTHVSLADDLAAAAGTGIRFDRIVGLNALGPLVDKAGHCLRLVELLNGQGRLVLAETVARDGTRLCEAARFESAELAELLAIAEEGLYSDPDNPLVNWDPQEVFNRCREQGGEDFTMQMRHYSGIRLFTPAEIDNWFAPRPQGARPSLGQRISEIASAQESGAIRQKLHALLDRRECAWRSAVMFLQCR